MSNLSVQQRIHELATAVGNEIKKVKQSVTEGSGAANEKIGTLSELDTTAKTSLVMAVNELAGKVSQVEQTANNASSLIDDAHTTQDKTWSSEKINDKINDAVSTAKTEVKNEILGHDVDGALDTLKEIGDKIKEGGNSVESLVARMDKAVVYDRQQTLSSDEQGNVLRALGFVDTNYVDTFNTALNS